MKITKILILVILTSVVNLVYTQQQCESEICTQLSQLCNTNVHNPSITSAIPGKRGPKGEKVFNVFIFVIEQRHILYIS